MNEVAENTQEFLNNIQQLINTRLSALLQFTPATCKKLQQALEYTVLSNGKRLRPALMYSLASNTDDTLLLDAACAVELVHTYSIIHDDLPAMDNDDIRRGKPSCHIAFDEATAILVGDALQSLAFKILSDNKYIIKNDAFDILQKQIKIINILSDAIGANGMVAGQSLELNNLTNGLDLALLNKIHLFKTGKLFTASLQISAIIKDFNINQYAIVTALGNKLGLAFQIQDDILDYTQNTELLGKPAHSDAKRNLQTYANLIGIQEATSILNTLWQEIYELINQLNSPSASLKHLIAHIQDRLY